MVLDTLYRPYILRNMTEIMAFFGVGEETVRRWQEQGAPISVEGAGSRKRYSAEAVALQRWRLEQCRKPQQ